MAKTWMITGASRGFGREFARAALERGDVVAATARDISTLDDLAAAHPETLMPVAMDVTDRASVHAAVAEVEDRLGAPEILVNNAGYGHFGAVEELSDRDLRDQFEVNVFGALGVTQAVLTGMRRKGRGHIVQISSIGGVGAFANLGAYHASKWALEALSESLATEVARFGIRVTIVEPGGFDTDWAGVSSKRSIPLPPYEAMREEAAARRSGQRPGDPAAAAQALLEVVDAAEPTLRVLFGAAAPRIVRDVYEKRLTEWAAWEDLAIRAHGHTDTERDR
jgi:NAD(P)-dependent dehydrogenase (short-subunit alcohol dehydrogenase family)